MNQIIRQLKIRSDAGQTTPEYVAITSVALAAATGLLAAFLSSDASVGEALSDFAAGLLPCLSLGNLRGEQHNEKA